MGHHYVPQFYLRGFAHEEALWMYDKRSGTSVQTTVKSIANETAMYSEDLETHLANKVEDPAKPAILKLRAGQHLTQEERIALAKYVVVLRKRVPTTRDRAVARLPDVTDQVRNNFHAQFDQLAEQNPVLLPKIDKRRAETDSIIAKQRQSPSRQIWYQIIKSPSDRLVDSLLSMNWVFLRSQTQQFLTGDNPVFFFENEGIAKATSELTWPISSSLALWATRLPVPSMRYVDASPPRVKEINRRTAYNSGRFVYARDDESWVRPFVNKRQWRLTRLQ